MKAFLFALPLLIMLSACGASTTAVKSPSGIAPPLPRATTGLDRVIGKDARSLVSMFGPAAQDVREETARKLQFASTDCILDAYLYPPSRGREPVVTYIAARTPDGRDAERQSCINALAKRR